ncbi:MAG TPA: CCA tRNA nucleotidyltransferase [Phycisphaerae bacterium]|nr:CCA tRNA nucleotidyltransferase [Phycisphaerae bacterium]
MSETFAFQGDLPKAAGAAVEIIRNLTAAGHAALLAGGCVRDLLRGSPPKDYDVATDATPDRVCQLFRATRKVGAQFGVVLVRKRRRWIEVATFRSDGPYLDGRHPARVTFSDARQDALRRDFTVNGMFLDPLKGLVIDYVDGRADLEAGLIRCIGEPSERFEEDHLRLLRAVRFAARLGFAVEPRTFAATQANAPKLLKVAAERVREELEKMLTPPARRRAFELMEQAGLLPYLWEGAAWQPAQLAAARSLLERLPAEAPFELAFAALVADRRPREINAICRALACSNDQRDATVWLVRHQADLDEPDAIPLASLKRLMAPASFSALRTLAKARYHVLPDVRERSAALQRRLSSIAPETVQPPPFITGDDLAQCGVEPGPIYKEILDELYTRQLDETIRSRPAALQALKTLLRARGFA